MKISAKQYAQGLLESVEGKKKEDVVKNIESLLRIMKENKDMKKSE